MVPTTSTGAKTPPTQPTAEGIKIITEALHKSRELELGVLNATRTSIVRIQLAELAFVAVFGCILLGYDPAPASAAETSKAQVKAWHDGYKAKAWFEDVRISHLEHNSEMERKPLWDRWSSVSASKSLTDEQTISSLFERIQYRGGIIGMADKITRNVIEHPDKQYPAATGADLLALPTITLDVPGSGPAKGSPPFLYSEQWPILKEETGITETDTVSAIGDKLREANARYAAIVPDLASASLYGPKTYSPWSDWRIGEFRALTDEDCATFQQLKTKLSAQWPDLDVDDARTSGSLGTPPYPPSMALGQLTVRAYLERTLTRLSAEAKKREDQKVRVVELWKLPVAIPVEGVLILLVPVALAFQALLFLMQTHVRARRVRVGTIEAELANLVPNSVGGAVIGMEWANSTNALHYIRKRQWSNLFEDDPNRFADVFHSVVVWLLVAAAVVQGLPIIGAWWHLSGGHKAFIVVCVIASLLGYLLARSVARQTLQSVRAWASQRLGPPSAVREDGDDEVVSG